MKKIICILAASMMMAFGSICSASDSSDLNSEQKAAQLFIDAFRGEKVPAYDVLSRNFSDGLKNQFIEVNYNGLQRSMKSNFGKLTEDKFYVYQRQDQNDVVIYNATFDSNKQAQLIFIFDKDKKLVNVSVQELNEQQQQ